MILASVLPLRGSYPEGRVDHNEDDGKPFAVLDLDASGDMPGHGNLNLGGLCPSEQADYLRSLAIVAARLSAEVGGSARVLDDVHELTTEPDEG